jgi:hypothetical protein
MKQKTPAEIKAKLRSLLHKAMEHYIQDHLEPCPENCRHALVLGNKVQPCPKCQANPGDPCRIRLRFEQRHSFEELKAEFRQRAGDRKWISRNLRDSAMLLWVLGQMGPEDEPDAGPLPDYLQHEPGSPLSVQPAWMHLDGNTLILSPEVEKLFAGFFGKLAERMPKP